MSKFWDLLSAMVEAIANFGAGTMSMGLNYEPKLPETLKK